MRYWDHLQERQVGRFTIIVDKSWEDIPVRDLFDDSCHDIDEYERKVNSGDLDWFILRARVLLNGAEIGEHIVGGFLYEDAREVLIDGMADDVIYGAACEADKWLATVFKERTIADYTLKQILEGA
jgi:hypothetical protein